MFEVTVENSFDFRSPEYRELFDKSVATAFQHPNWLSCLYGELLAANSATPLIIVTRFRADGRLAMVLPLIRRRYAALRVIEFADMRVSDYVSPVADSATFDAVAADTASVAKIRQLLKPYDLLRIGKLADRSLHLEKLLGIRNREKMGMSAYATPLETTFPAWREKRIKKSYCKELDKKSRQLHRRGDVRFECVTDPVAMNTAFEAMRTYRGERFKDRDGIGDLLQLPAYYKFYTDIAKAGRDGSARTYALWLDEKPIAVALGLAHRNSLLVVLGGFDFDFKNMSIGSLMFEQVARDCIERGESFLDFTIGDEPYKLTFGSEPSPMWQISRSGSPLGYTAGLVVEKLPVAKSLARRLFHGARDEHAAAGKAPADATPDEVGAS
jgi:CelD/BcsL family acetyltransferase involved in cellulose biosynthesis